MALNSINSKPEAETPSDEILSLLEQRKAARDNKNFAESDRLREVITALGWTVKDTKEGQQWAKS